MPTELPSRCRKEPSLGWFLQATILLWRLKLALLVLMAARLASYPGEAVAGHRYRQYLLKPLVRMSTSLSERATRLWES
jgi:hypothetical protein